MPNARKTILSTVTSILRPKESFLSGRSLVSRTASPSHGFESAFELEIQVSRSHISDETRYKMTVSELITELSKIPQDTKAFSLGYEGGFDEIVRVDIKKLKNTANNDEWWNGTHEQDDLGETCVVLQTNRR